jgi:hypothetical protein
VELPASRDYIEPNVFSNCIQYAKKNAPLADWVSKLSPQAWRKPLAFFSGWLLVLAWQAVLASVAYFGGIIIQVM